jgi:hypothetical protein
MVEKVIRRSFHDVIQHPRSESELMSAVERQHQEYIQFILEKWKPVGEVVTETNLLVNNFLLKTGQKLDIEIGETYNSLYYLVQATLRGSLCKVYSRQTWRTENAQDPLLGQLASIWNSVDSRTPDQFHVAIIGEKYHELNLTGRSVEYFLFDYPTGGILVQSSSLARAMGGRADFNIVPHSPDRAFKAASYFKDLTTQLLKRPDAKVFQNK